VPREMVDKNERGAAQARLLLTRGYARANGKNPRHPPKRWHQGVPRGCTGSSRGVSGARRDRGSQSSEGREDRSDRADRGLRNCSLPSESAITTIINVGDSRIVDQGEIRSKRRMTIRRSMKVYFPFMFYFSFVRKSLLLSTYIIVIFYYDQLLIIYEWLITLV